MNTSLNQKIEDLIKKLNTEQINCFKCNKTFKKEQIINIYNHKNNDHKYLCKHCFKRKGKT